MTVSVIRPRSLRTSGALRRAAGAGWAAVTFALAMGLACAGVLAAEPRTAPSSQLLLQWKQAVGWRLDFQATHPEARRVFSAPLDAATAKALLAAWPVGPYADTGAAAWRTFGASLLHEKANPGSGKPGVDALERAWAAYPGRLFELGSVESRVGWLNGAASAMESVAASLMEQGYRTAREFSVPQLWRARKAMTLGQWVEAEKALDAAEWLDPLTPFVPLTRLELSLRKAGPFGVDLGQVWTLASDAVGRWVQPAMGASILYNFLRGFRLAVMAYFGAFLFALLIRHFPMLAHSTVERLPGSVEFKHRYIAVAVAVGALWMAGLGTVFLALLLIPWIWPHAHSGERRKMGWMFIGAFLLPGWQYLEDSLLSFQDPQTSLHWVNRAWESGYDPNLADRIEGYSPSSPEDSANRALAASLQYKKQGHYLRAEAWLSRAPLSAETRPDFLLQKGNLALLTFQFREADGFYAKVRNQYPGNFEALFNASQSALFQNESDRHKDLLDRAAELDARSLTAYLKANDQLFLETPANRRVMDPGLQVPMLLRAVADEAMRGAFLRTEIQGGLISVPGVWFLFLTGASFALMSFRSRRSVVVLQGKALFECKICGRIMCRQCRKGVHCEPCFKAVSGVSDTKIRSELIDQLRGKARAGRRLVGKTLNAVAPGTGEIYLGRRGLRFPWLICLSAAIGLLLEMRRPAMEYPAFALGFLGWLPWALLLLVYLGFHGMSVLPQAGRETGGAKP